MPRSKLISVLVCVLIFMALGAIFLHWYNSDIGASVKRSSSALVAYRAAGMPWIAKDLASAYEGAQDPTDLLKRTSAYTENTRGLKQLEDANGYLLAGSADRAKKAIDYYRPALTIASQIAGMHRVNFNLDLDYSSELEFHQYTQLKGLIRILGTKAQIDATIGDLQASCSDLSTAWKLTKLLDHESTTVAFLVEFSCENTVFDKLQKCAYILRDSPEGLNSLTKSVSFEEELPNLQQLMKSEAYTEVSLSRNVAVFQRYNADGGMTNIVPKAEIVRDGFAHDKITESAQVHQLELWTIYSKDLQTYKLRPLALKEAFQRDADTYAKSAGDTNIFNEITSSMLSQVLDAAAKVDSTATVTHEYLRALRWRAQTHRELRSLKELGEVPLDPCDEKPLKFKRSKNKFLIYSVGPSGVDVGGLVQWQVKGSSAPYNIAASFPPLQRPERATRDISSKTSN